MVHIVRIDTDNPRVFGWSWGDQKFHARGGKDIRPEVWEWCDNRAKGRWGENSTWELWDNGDPDHRRHYYHEFVFLDRRVAQLFQVIYGQS